MAVTKIAKITCPIVTEIFARRRLFDLLDRMRKRPVIWVSGPPGSGKTTLVASYLDARSLPCLWYQIDQGDSDPATFFYYMGLAAKRAAPRKRRPLPLLTSEYLQGISTFTLRYFEELYSRLNPPQPHHNPPTAILKKENPPYPPFAKVGKGRFAFAKGSKGGFIIVFDNYHEVPANSPFHEIILNGLSQILEGINVILISRSDPPPALIRLRANRQMEILRWNDLRLTLEESEGIWIPMETLWSRKTCIPSVPKNLLGNFCMARANGKESRVAAKLRVLRAPNQ